MRLLEHTNEASGGLLGGSRWCKQVNCDNRCSFLQCFSEITIVRSRTGGDSDNPPLTLSKANLNCARYWKMNDIDLVESARRAANNSNSARLPECRRRRQIAWDEIALEGLKLGKGTCKDVPCNPGK